MGDSIEGKTTLIKVFGSASVKGSVAQSCSVILGLF